MNHRLRRFTQMLSLIRGLVTSSPTRARLANERLLALANAYEEGEGKWIQLAMLGDFPHAQGTQRIDAKAVTTMANSFNSLVGKLKQRFVGVPWYEGHPDVAHLANQYPDKRAHGWIKAMEARADGLWAQVDWTPTGKALLENGNYKYFSPHWEADEVGIERGRKVYRPTQVLSVGFTNYPNTPVNPLSNTKENEMDRALLITALGLAATADDAAITTAIGNLKAEKTTLANDKSAAATALETERAALAAEKTTLANERAALATARTQLTNVQGQRNKIALDNAIDKGRITPAQRAEWEPKLNEDFDKALGELNSAKGGMKTTATTAGAGGRRATLANEEEYTRTQKVQDLVKKEQKESGCDYAAAFEKVRMANAGLFEQMHDSLAAQS